MPCERTHSRRTRCESATTGVGAGAAWSTKTATFVVSHTRSFPRSRSPAMTASMTESCTMTRETGAMTRSPAVASRSATRDRIFSATVLGNDPVPKKGVELVHRQWTGVSERLDATRDLPKLVFAELEAELPRPMVDRVLARETVRDVDRSREPEVGWIEDLVAVGVQVDRFRVNPRLVMERVLTGHEVVVRDVDSDERGHELVEVPQLRQVVLLPNRGRVIGVHTRDETAERGDAVALADTEHARVDVGGSSFKDRVAVGDRATGVVVSVELDVAPNMVAQLDRERVALAWRGDTDRVRDAYAVPAHSVHPGGDLEQVALG